MGFATCSLPRLRQSPKCDRTPRFFPVAQVSAPCALQRPAWTETGSPGRVGRSRSMGRPHLTTVNTPWFVKNPAGSFLLRYLSSHNIRAVAVIACPQEISPLRGSEPAPNGTSPSRNDKKRFPDGLSRGQRIASGRDLLGVQEGRPPRGFPAPVMRPKPCTRT